MARCPLFGPLFLAFASTLVAAMTTSGPCGVEPTIIHDQRTQSDGSVIAEDNRRFPAGCFWESPTGDNSTLVLGCDSKVTCLWKCCPQGQVLDAKNKCITIEIDNQTFRPRFNVSSFHILTGNPCVERFRLNDGGIDNIEDNGMLKEKLPKGKGKSFYPAGGYCLDQFQNGTTFETVALVCYPNEEEEVAKMAGERRDDVTFVIYTIGRFIALPFLIATVAVYAVIPELRNLHGKCLVSHVTSLSLAYVFLIIIALSGRGLVKWFCVASALTAYFFLLGSFFWLNVMCFDIWWTFSGHRRVIGSKGSNEQQEFLFYSLYAWGAPVVMLCISVIIDFAPNVPDYYIKPEFGVDKCWFKDDKVTVLAYFSGPVAFLIASNIVFFAVTAFNILRIRKQTSVLSNPDSRRNDNRKNNEQRFVLYLKLFVVMGVTWSLDLIGWAIGGPDYIWWVTDLANILQGVLIFVIFVWKARVRKLLRQRFQCLPSRNSISPTASATAMGSYS